MNQTKNQFTSPFWLKLLTLVLVLLTGSYGLAVEQLSDVEKRHVIEKMYLDFQASFPEVADIDPFQAVQLASKKDVVFIDTRNPKEQRVSMLPNAITAKVFLKNPEKYRNHIKIAYCTIAYRSGNFAQKFSKKGMLIFNLRGGMLAWIFAGGRVYDQTGPTNRIHVYGRKWDLAPEQYKTIW